jgi:hypothetical protein
MSGSEITTDTAANALTALAPVSPTLPASDANNRPTEEPASGETGAPAASDSNVFSQIKLIESDLEAWSEGKDQRETKAMVAQKLYGDLSALGLMIYEVPSGNPVHRVIADKLKKSARTIAEQSDVQAVIQAGSRFWIRENKLNASLGLALIGEVVSAEVASGEWVLKISPEVSSRPLRIVVPGMLTPSIEIGQKLLLLGATKDTTEITSDETADNALSQAPKEFTFVANYLYTL